MITYISIEKYAYFLIGQHEEVIIMHYSSYHRFFGLLLVIVGLVGLILAIGTLLLRLAAAFVALMIIRAGMRMYMVSSAFTFSRYGFTRFFSILSLGDLFFW
jgi:hypothetical protein